MPDTKPSKLEFVGALRGLAATYVVLFHLWHVPQPPLLPPGFLQPFLHAGGSGVTLFFVVSAFTLSLSMEIRKDEARPLTKYFLRRFFRIVPLFYVWLAMMVVLLGIWHGGIYEIKLLLLNVGFGFNFFPGKEQGIVMASWTLGVEMVFYLLLPLLLSIANSWARAVWLFVATILLAVAWRVIAFEVLSLSTSYHGLSFLRQLPVFVVGIFCYHIYRRLRDDGHQRLRFGYSLIALACIGHAALVVPLTTIDRSIALYGHAIVWGVLLIGLALVPFRLFVNPATRFLGTLAYSLYLNHPMAIIIGSHTFHRLANSQVAAMSYPISAALLISALIPISYVTYRMIEGPGIRLGNYLIAALDRMSAARRVGFSIG